MILLSGASLFTIFLPLIIALEVASRKIYRVNLDLNPRVRWNHVIDEHKHLIPEILQEIKYCILFSFEINR
jgi:hypothetical protein